MDNLIKEYVSQGTNPTFGNFCKEYEQEIISYSKELRFSSAMSLQHKWEDRYRNSSEVHRPELTKSKRSGTPNTVFNRVHTLICSQRETNFRILNNSTRLIGEFSDVATEMIRPSSSFTVAEGTTGDSLETEEEKYIGNLRSALDCKLDKKKRQQTSQQRPAFEESNMHSALFKIAEQLLEKDEAKNSELEVCKLCLSSTISFVSPKINAIFEALLPTPLYNEAKSVSETQKVNLECSLETKNVIDKITNDLLPFENDLNTNRCVAYLDKLKYKEEDKQSTPYQILCITDKIVASINTLRKLKNPHEAFWVRKFIEVVEVMFADTDLVVSDGESICKDTRAASSGSVFGRRVDMLVGVGNEENAINLASFEAKKEGERTNLQLYQQLTNHRINSSILNRANCLVGTSELNCIYIDIIGSTGYMVQLTRHNDYFVCQGLTNFHIPTELLEISFLKSFLMKLYAWKSHIIEQSIQLKKSLIARKRKFSLIETFADPDEGAFEVISPIKVYHSP